MAGCRRQVRHQDEEVEQASENHGGSLFEEAGQHEPVVSCPRLVASKRGFARSCLVQGSSTATAQNSAVSAQDATPAKKFRVDRATSVREIYFPDAFFST